MTTLGATGAPRRGPALLLTATALALAVLIGVQLTRLSGTLIGGTSASADVVNQLGDFQMLSVDSGKDDVVIMIDQRTESLLVYHATQTGLKFLGRRDVKDIFSQARVAAGR
ncbi:MAG: hypothetical protein AB7K52_13185 [Phycisphaerales bacterium]